VLYDVDIYDLQHCTQTCTLVSRRLNDFPAGLWKFLLKSD